MNAGRYAVVIEFADDPGSTDVSFGPRTTLDECLEYKPDASETDAGRVTIRDVGSATVLYQWLCDTRCWRRV